LTSLTPVLISVKRILGLFAEELSRDLRGGMVTGFAYKSKDFDR
jgi:hypothetical protein